MPGAGVIKYDFIGLKTKRNELIQLAAVMIMADDIQKLNSASTHCSGWTYEKLQMINELLKQTEDSLKKIVMNTITFLSTTMEITETADLEVAKEIAAIQVRRMHGH
jgi:hypothetical protein